MPNRLHDWRYVDSNKAYWHGARQVCQRCGALREYNGMEGRFNPAREPNSLEQKRWCDK